MRRSTPLLNDALYEVAGGETAEAEPGQEAFRSHGATRHLTFGQALRQQVVDETGIPASHVDQSRGGTGAGGGDQLERRRGPRLEPARARAGPRRMDPVPVPLPFLFVRHGDRSLTDHTKVVY